MTEEYNLDMLGLKLKGLESKAQMLIMAIIFAPVMLLIWYLITCMCLYAFVQLTGLLTFTWTNGLYAMILLIVANSIFSRGD